MTKCTKTAAGLTTARAFVAFSVSADAGHTGGAGHLGGFGGFRGDGGHAAFVGHAGPNISLANLDMDITVRCQKACRGEVTTHSNTLNCETVRFLLQRIIALAAARYCHMEWPNSYCRRDSRDKRRFFTRHVTFCYIRNYPYPAAVERA